jgi:sortase A
MSKIQFFSIVLGCGLVVLGIVTTVAAAVNIISNTPPPSIFDQTDDVLAPEQGSAPLIVPTIPLRITQPKGQEYLTPGKAITRPNPTASLPTLTVPPEPIWIPDRIVIPAIQLDAPAVPATLRMIEYLGKTYPQWRVPNFFTAGWAPTSASLGITGNTVFFGHHNVHGEVFAHLVDLQVNDLIMVYSGEKTFAYIIALKMILPERNQPIETRLQNAAWILPSDDERITLLTCWPYTTNTHRLIIVAIPISLDSLKNHPLTLRLTPLPTPIPE